LQPPTKEAAATAQDLPDQIEQLRNDIFGIAMNVSALNDRLDRLEQRLPPAGQSAQAGIATLRGEIETWLENHLSAAVEHCMNQIISRTNSSVSHPVN
jgi:predicted  nucleic acid-binding Zn-ribbon protein